MEEVKNNKNNIQKIKELFQTPIPKEYLIQYEVNDGKVLTGYRGQYAIDLLNEKIGLGKWNTDEIILHNEQYLKGYSVAMKLILTIPKYHIKVTGYGGAYAKRISDAFKAAKTSAFKNACRYLGIGKELYYKGFEEDIIIEEKNDTEEVKFSSNYENDLMSRIKEATQVAQLNSLQNELMSLENGKVKELLIKELNNKKIELNA